MKTLPRILFSLLLYLAFPEVVRADAGPPPLPTPDYSGLTAIHMVIAGSALALGVGGFGAFLVAVVRGRAGWVLVSWLLVGSLALLCTAIVAFCAGISWIPAPRRGPPDRRPTGASSTREPGRPSTTKAKTDSGIK